MIQHMTVHTTEHPIWGNEYENHAAGVYYMTRCVYELCRRKYTLPQRVTDICITRVLSYQLHIPQMLRISHGGSP